MRGALPALGAGMTFAGTVLVGFGAGFWVSRQTGASWWVIVGLFAGVFLGGFSAMKVLLAAGRQP